MTNDEAMRAIETQLSHVWMVRAFLKHSDEATDDEELAEIHRTLYDYQLAVGAALKEGNALEYIRQATKKSSKLRQACETFTHIQPEVSSHTNFEMAVRSLNAAVIQIGRILEETKTGD